ncbi:MAG: HIT family protein [Pseudomonadota bacterium]|nr:HIT family protein [Pseudomonadota bacterium]
MKNKQALSSCPFCSPEKLEIVAHSRKFYVINDNAPVTPEHCLIIPYHHIADPLDLKPEEITEIWQLVQNIRKKLLAEDPSISGFNVGFNSGHDAGQTIFHTHIHLIPRRCGDVEKPRGGVRGVIPARQSY